MPLNILQTEDSYDYCENEKVIHLSFIYYFNFVFKNHSNIPCI